MKSAIPITFHQMPRKIDTLQHIVKQKNRIENKQIENFEFRFEAYNHSLDTINKSNEKMLSKYVCQLVKQSQMFRKIRQKENQEEGFSFIQSNNIELSNTNMSINHSLQLEQFMSTNLFILKIENEKLKYQEKLLLQKLEYHKILNYRTLGQTQTGNSYKNPNLQLKKKQRQLMRQQVETLQSLVLTKKIIEEYYMKFEAAHKLQQIIEKIKKGQLNKQSQVPRIRNLVQILDA